jgi:transcriptional regulator with XRE-family HTH domain
MLIVDGVGDRLREERERLALNQTDFGALANVSRGTQKAYEQGTNSPDLRYVAQLQEAGVDVQYVLCGRRLSLNLESLSADQSLLLEQYANLSPDDKQAARRVIGALSELGLSTEK